jgi:hypothetical protein
MFAHEKLELPENLLPDDVADLLAGLGYRVDRRNVTRALEAADIPGVVSPASRATRWVIPRDEILDVLAAVLLRRALRSAAPGRYPVGDLTQYHLPAARLLMQVPAFDKYVPPALQRRVKAEYRARREAEEERKRQRLAEAERERRREVRQREQDEKRRNDAAALVLYCEFRNCACDQLVAGRGSDSPEFANFLKDWPGPGLSRAPAWWAAPPGLLQKARERTDAWIDGRAKGWPNVRDLIPNTNYAVPWPWRTEVSDA